MIRVLAFSGSLRRGSFNTALLREAAERAPEGVSVTIHAIDDVPVFNEDVRLAGEPQSVTRLKQAIRDADAVLIATPEYNGSISGVLKNALDWISRPMKDSPLKEKPVAILGAGGGLGTVRAQDHLKYVLGILGAHAMVAPSVRVERAPTKFDEAGRLTDEATIERLPKLLGALRDWTLRLQATAPGA
jgi:chromate reductase